LFSKRGRKKQAKTGQKIPAPPSWGGARKSVSYRRRDKSGNQSMPLARRQALPLGVEHQIMKGIPGIAINANTKYTPIFIYDRIVFPTGLKHVVCTAPGLSSWCHAPNNERNSRTAYQYKCNIYTHRFRQI